MRKRKYLGAVLSALFVILYYSGAALLFAGQPDIPLGVKVLLYLLPLGACGVTVLVLLQRIRELRSGETDDLDNY